MKLLRTVATLVGAAASFAGAQNIGVSFTRSSVWVGGNVYNYIQTKPSGTCKGTVVLLHGFPDLSFGWRYQIPFLTNAGYQVIAPDMLGYGRTSAPTDLRQYALKKMSDDLATLIRLVVGPGRQVILGGHDWGAAMAYRAVLYHPTLYKAFFTVTVPYFPPVPTYIDLADAIAQNITTPTFGYQLQLRDPATDARLQGAAKIRQMLLALYGAVTPEGQPGFSATQGLLWENLPRLGRSPLVSDADLDFYVAEYVKNTVRGPFSWYRTAKINFDDELPLVRAGINRLKFVQPALFIAASNDTALPPVLSEGMEKYFVKLQRAEVVSSHWALWQAAAAVNKLIGDFVAKNA